MGDLDFEHKKIWVLGLLIDCPMGKPLENCPAKDTRALPIEERLRLANAMDERQLDQIISHHRKCLHEREHRIPYQNR
ncbi:MAG: hypothetical protein JRE64_11750 [Deltaproteobacteria bacterium]|nr:hypothetical protein [Deltaproteobacteria bacterium]